MKPFYIILLQDTDWVTYHWIPTSVLISFHFQNKKNKIKRWIRQLFHDLKGIKNPAKFYLSVHWYKSEKIYSCFNISNKKKKLQCIKLSTNVSVMKENQNDIFLLSCNELIFKISLTKQGPPISFFGLIQ